MSHILHIMILLNLAKIENVAEIYNMTKQEMCLAILIYNIMGSEVLECYLEQVTE